MDAKIQRIEELSAYSRYLSNFSMSMSKNFTSLNDVMMQKLEQLRHKVKEAEEIELEARREHNKCFHDLAACPSSEIEEKKRLLLLINELEHKKRDAQRLCSVVKEQYNVARGAVLCMLDNTKSMQVHIQNNIDKGQRILKNASVQLEQYKDNSKKYESITVDEQ